VATGTRSKGFTCGPDCTHNLFRGLPPSGTAALVADPRFADPTRRGSGRLALGRAFRLRAGSPARGAGVRLPAMGRSDYFGSLLGAGPPSIGFDQRH
jgi:hypothetical protein